MVGYTGNKPALQARLKRIEGQVRGLQRMVDEDVYCIEVLTQVSAATRALQGFSLQLLEDHLEHCVHDVGANCGDERDVMVKEAIDAIRRLVRSS